MGHLGIAPTMDIQRGPHDHPPGTPLLFCLTPAFPFSVAAFPDTELQFSPHALKLRLLRVLQLLRLSQLHHGITDHLHTTRPSLSFSPAPLRSTSPAFVLLVRIPLGLPAFRTALNPLTFLLCRALYAPSGVSPASIPQRRPTLVMLADKHTRNVPSLSDPSDHKARGVLTQDALARTPLWSTMMKQYPSANGHRDLKQADRNNSGRLALSPQASICPPPLLGHHPMVTSLLNQSKVIIRPMKDGDGKRTFELGLIVTDGIQTPKTKPPEAPPTRLSRS
ncbi:hypothetical protein O181_126151 [Austropuccinia psidii MF-1]|uniref:Uncharacterized protein n=1 Tax=Austropuccinia psidii MF-1 TaxID=1389203 RepID=A0A9Q3KUJ5_9BASI|nr:hypothetical protein [Austropuccinia psidii MF-1]